MKIDKIDKTGRAALRKSARPAALRYNHRVSRSVHLLAVSEIAHIS